MTPWFRVGGTGSLQSVHFGDTEDTLRTAGFEATLDTRGDPAFPRNAIYASLGWDRLWFDHAADTNRLDYRRPRLSRPVRIERARGADAADPRRGCAARL